MKISQQLIAFLFLIALTIKEGLSLECYSCNTFVDKDLCWNPGPDTKKETCSDNQTMCRKVEQEINIKGEDTTRVIRQCATSGSLGECLERTGTYRFKSWYCQCKGELCNGTGSVVMSVSLTLGAIIAFFGLRKLL